MVMRWTILAFFLAAGTSPSLFANPKFTYQIRTEVYIDGKLISSPTIITREGETASISQNAQNETENNLTVGMVATEQPTLSGKDGILLKLNVEYKNGIHSGRFNSEVLTASGKQATVKPNSGTSSEGVELKITATRQ